MSSSLSPNISKSSPPRKRRYPVTRLTRLNSVKAFDGLGQKERTIGGSDILSSLVWSAAVSQPLLVSIASSAHYPLKNGPICTTEDPCQAQRFDKCTCVYVRWIPLCKWGRRWAYHRLHKKWTRRGDPSLSNESSHNNIGLALSVWVHYHCG